MTGVAGLIVKASVAVPVPPVLVAPRVTLEVPTPAGVPVTSPELVLTDKPDGSPVALKLVGLLVAAI
jgi:hypothetical protein